MKQTIRYTIKMMLAASLTLLVILRLFAQNQTAQDIKGKWQGEQETDMQLEIYEENGKYYGKVSTDNKKAPKGHLLLRDLVWNEKPKIYQGTFHAPNISVESKISIVWIDKDKFEFTVKKLLMSKTIRFVRIKK